MHFTPCPRWLRIVSTATVVLPVLRSPMMSSRCPRPMGVIASIALMPVWSGSCPGLPGAMPGARVSGRRFSLVAIWALTVVGLNDATCRRRASAISSALMVSSGMGDIPRSHLTLELVEAVAHRSVDHDVADTRDEAAHHAGIDDDLDLDLFAGRAAQ